MVRQYSEADVVAVLEDLDPARLQAFVRGHVVLPVVTPEGHLFTDTDLARLRLLCELSDIFDLPEDTLAMVVSLIDQLNTARGDLRALVEALASEPADMRGRVLARLQTRRTDRT